MINWNPFPRTLRCGLDIVPEISLISYGTKSVWFVWILKHPCIMFSSDVHIVILLNFMLPLIISWERTGKQLPMMPGFLLSGHLNLYLSTQNLATFATILSTPHNHIAQPCVELDTLTDLEIDIAIHWSKHEIVISIFRTLLLTSKMKRFAEICNVKGPNFNIWEGFEWACYRYIEILFENKNGIEQTMET